MSVNRVQRRVRRGGDSAYATIVRNQSILLATDQIIVDSFGDILRIQITNSTGAGITLTSTPSIQPGRFNGQFIKMMVMEGGNNIILQDEAVLPGSGLRLQAAANKTVGPRDQIGWCWDASIGFWLQSETLIAV
jgi:hypothetical protein